MTIKEEDINPPHHETKNGEGEGTSTTNSEWQIVKAVLGADEFALKHDGLYQIEGNDEEIKPVMLVSAPLKIIADTRDVNGENWGRILEFRDKDGILQQYHMKMQDLRRDGEDVVDALLSRGLSIAPGKKARLRLVDYIQNTEPKNGAKARSTDKTGWHNHRFVLPNEVIGEGDDQVIYSGRQPEPGAYQKSGTLEEWQENVSKLCVGNSRLVLAVSTAFAAPLLTFVGDESGGLHFVGNSSTGKSTALHVASSVMGLPKRYIQSWRATSNGLEGIAKVHNDTCLMLDELSQVQPKEAGEIAYMLANEAGKLRANIKGDPRQKSNWKLLFLSSGEITLTDHMQEGGKKSKAGQEIRLVDIQADAGKGMGIFEDIHSSSSGAVFSDLLKANTARYHGTAFRSFITLVLANVEGLRDLIANYRQKLISLLVPHDASGQVQRVAARFALVAAAGELATIHGITKWKEGEAACAVQRCFKSWLDLRGGTDNQETTSLLNTVRGFFEQHGDSRFIKVVGGDGAGYKIVDSNQRVLNRAGFRYTSAEGHTSFLVLPQALHEICAGFNFRASVKVLVENGIISPGPDGKSQKSVRLPGMGPKKVYNITGKIWQEPEIAS